MQTKRRIKTGFESLLFLVIAIAIIVTINVLVLAITTKKPIRLDLTYDQRYTLSETSRKLISELEGEVKIYAFINKDLPTPDTDLFTTVGDLLAEYKTYSEGKLKVLLIDPEDNEEAEEEAKGYGIERVPVVGRTSQSAEFRMAYKGIYIEYNDRKEVIPAVKMSDNLEYEITRVLLKITTEDRKKIVAFLVGHREIIETDQFKQLVLTQLRELYDIRFVNLAKGDNLYQFGDKRPVRGRPPADPGAPKRWYDALVILSPQTQLFPAEQYKIDQFLMRGAGVAFFLGPVLHNFQSQQKKAQLGHKLEPLLEHYGVILGNKIIEDQEKNILVVRSAKGNDFIAREPFAPLIRMVDRSNPIIREVPALAFPLTSSVTPTKELLQKKEGNLSILAETYESSVKRDHPQFLEMLREEPAPKESPKESIPVALAYAGPVDSFFATVDERALLQQSVLEDQKIVSTQEAHLLVAGNGEFLQLLSSRLGETHQLGMYGLRFLENSIDWLVQDTSLVAIRMKGTPTMMDSNRIPSKKIQGIYKFGNILGPPFGFLIIVGGLLFLFRLYRKKKIKKLFSQPSASSQKSKPNREAL